MPAKQSIVPNDACEGVMLLNTPQRIKLNPKIISPIQKPISDTITNGGRPQENPRVIRDGEAAPSDARPEVPDRSPVAEADTVTASRRPRHHDCFEDVEKGGRDDEDPSAMLAMFNSMMERHR